MANIVNLKEYLRRVFKDLKEYTDGLSPEELEEFHEKCRNLFKNGEGDYSDRYLLAYYVMEYARAYGFEFSRAYTDILARILKSKKEVSSVSFGCGTGIDYWGMSHAARVILRMIRYHSAIQESTLRTGHTRYPIHRICLPGIR